MKNVPRRAEDEMSDGQVISCTFHNLSTFNKGVKSMQCIYKNKKKPTLSYSFTPSHWLLAFLLLSTSLPLFAAPAYDATIKNLAIENNLIIHKTYSASVEVKNIGSQTWNPDKNVSLTFTSATSQSLGLPSRVLLKSTDNIKPGQTKTFKFNVTAPAKTGIYSLEVEMKQGNKNFGTKSEKIDLIVETHVHRVKFISQLLPETMETGQEYSIVVQYKNTGSATWDRSRGYKLGLRSGLNVWNTSHLFLEKSSVVTTGDLATFRFKLKAPDKAGIYPIQWQMLRGKNWFGEKTPTQYISVKESASSSGAEFVYQDVPGLKKAGQSFAIFERGKVYPVSLTFKNMSDENWIDGRYSLNAQNPPNSLTWSVDRVDLKSTETIKPGDFKTFSFKIIAPLKPGIYNFQWQMVKGFNTWIGEKSENISITVK